MITKNTIMPIILAYILASCSSVNYKNKNISYKMNQEVLTLFPIEHYDQHVTKWINPDSTDYNTALLTPEIQQKHFKLFYEHNYGELSPWNKNFVNSVLAQDIILIQQELSNKYNNRGKVGNDIGYGENYRPYPPAWADQIADNMDIAQFINLSYKDDNRVIAIDNLYARALPTNDVHFYNNKIAGQGYPFDNLQMSTIWSGTPLYLVGITKDKGWSLVITPSGFVAWVESVGIVKTSSQFIASWQKAAKLKLGAITHTKTSIIDTNGRFLFYGYVGAVFPIVDNKSSTYKQIIIPGIKDNQAVIQYAMLSIKDIETMPLSPTKHNMTNIISSLVGRPYGWGNKYFYNDCSGELKNLFTPFGIWLPKGSVTLANIAKKHFDVVDMSFKNASERLSYLMQNGKPFFTIVHINGHVFLYIGNYTNNKSLMAMTYQNVWGLHRVDKNGRDENTRVVIGGTVFFPLLLQYPEIPDAESLAAKPLFEILYLNKITE